MTETSTLTHAELTQRLAEVERERDSLRLELEGCKQANEMLHQDKRELAAMVGRLREDVYAMADRIHGEWGTSKQTADDFLPESYHETPPTALRHMHDERNQAIQQAVRAARQSWVTQGDKPINEIRAEAVEAAIKECKMLVLDGPDMHSGCLADYAQQLRNGDNNQ